MTFPTEGDNFRTLKTFTAKEKHKEAQRELHQRRRVYPRFVADKGMKQEQADRQIAIMEAIAADYAVQMAQEEEQHSLFGRG